MLAADAAPGLLGCVLILGLTAGCVWRLDVRARQPYVPNAEIFVPVRFIVGVFAVLSVSFVLYDHLVLDAFARGRFGYLEWLAQVTSLVAARGIWNVWTPYPQGTQALIVGLQAVANALGGLTISDVWTAFTLFRLGFEALFLVGPAIATVWLTAETGRTFGRSTATLAALTTALSFGVIYYGAASVYVTDVLPAAVSLAAVLAALRGRFVVAGLAIGLGAALKLFPILLLPAMVVLLPRRAAVRLTLAALCVLVLAFAPFAVMNPEVFISPFNWQSSRPPWETWFAFANWLSGAPHDFSQPYFQDASVGSAYGWIFTGITPPASVLQTPVPPGPPRWENAVSLVGTLLALGCVLLARRCAAYRSRAIIRWSLFSLCSFLIFAIGWSPQYELYLIPFVLLAFESPFIGAAAALLLQAVTFLDYPLLLPWAEFYGGAPVWLDWGAVLARYIVLGWLCLYVLRSELSFGVLQRRLPRRAAVAATTLASSMLIAAWPAAASAQTQRCGASHPPPVTSMPFDPSRDWSIAGGWFFAEASPAPGLGFSVIDDANAQIWSEFSRLGGWQSLGFPASQRFMWHGLLTQVTQRAVLQWSSVSGQLTFADVLDLLHDAGRDADLTQQMRIPPPLDVEEAGQPYGTIAANRLGWLDSRPAIKAAYCNPPGGADPIQLWGLPTSQAVNMDSSGGQVYVLRTQRAAFQEWVDGAAWAAPGEVTVVLAGDLAKAFNLLPQTALMPLPPP